ncbi:MULTISPECIES: AI-2E family transporter [Microbacterium]|jgi:predicted PurR-regulated permease PerM|uniref:AI-2E family transporter n=1 Tax=Microbacterium algeriense TaxID=2615184 RepID=A0ABQ6V5Z5_9MICO|nr:MULTISPECIES: AI-2E family transporter [Microbacterium]AZH78458.1 AI-2E family transporter [Microbacterium sp. Y-01]KAB1864589.1 AI-2E family transporter [Microbacterium algeriense]MDX2398109.1 AI-2E family transporter [Microbacterium algeriense]
MKIHNPFRTALVATLGVGLGILLISSVQTLSTVLLYLGTALFLSLGLDPLVSFLERRRLPRWLAVVVTILAVLGVFVGIVLIILPVLVDQISQLIAQISAIVQRGNLIPDLKEWMQATFPNLLVDDVFTYVTDWLTTNLTEIGGSIGQGVLVASGAVLSGLFGAFIVLILTIYLTASTPSLKRAVYQLAPASKRDRFIDLAEQITDSVGYYVMGQVSQGVINGVLSAIYLSIIQAPFPAVLAVVAFFFSLIPLVGTLTGSTIIVLVCLLPGLGSPGTAIAAAIYYLIYMQIEAYIISPRIMSRAVSVPGAVVVVAALAGGSLLGLLGALIAIPVAASILILYRQVLIPRMNEL